MRSKPLTVRRRNGLPAAVSAYALAVVVTAAMVLLRGLLDPWLGNRLVLVTLYGAVAAAVWYGGFRPAWVATVLGYVSYSYLFIEPRGSLALLDTGATIGLILYLLTCSIIIGFGEAMRVAQCRAQEERELLRVTFASLGEAIITTDPQGRITALNAAAESLIGLTPPEAVGQPLDTAFRLVDEQTRTPLENPVTRAWREGATASLANQSILIGKDGTIRPIDGSTAPLKDAQGDVIGSVVILRDLTAHKRAEAEEARLNQQLHERVQELQTLLDILPVPVWIGDAECHWILGNTAAYQSHGIARGSNASFDAPVQELPPGLRVIADGRDLQPHEMPMQVAARTAKPVVAFEHEVVHPDGRRIALSANVAPLLDHAGKVRGVVGVYLDITNRKQTEQVLRESEARQAFLLTLSDAIRPLADPREIQGAAARVLGEHLGVDRAFYTEVVIEVDLEFFLIERDYHTPETPSLVGRYPVDRFGPALIPQYRLGRRFVVADVEADPALTRQQREAYLALDIRAYIGVPLLKQGQFLAVLGVHQRAPRAWTPAEVALVEETAERTWAAVERAHAEAALRTSEARYRFLVESTSDLVFSVGLRQPLPLALAPAEQVDWIFREGFLTAANAGFARAHGYGRAEEVVGMALAEALPRTPENEAMARTLVECGHRLVEAQTEEVDRFSSRKVLLNSIVGRIEGGSVQDYLGTARDITERVLAEEALRASEANFRAMFEVVGVGMVQADPATRRILRVNATFCTLTGYAETELLGGMTVDQLNHPDDRAKDQALHQQLVRGETGPYVVEKRYVRKDGGIRWVNVAGNLMHDAQGHPVCISAVVQDVTARRQAEDTLREREEFTRRITEVAPSILYVYDLEAHRNVWGNREMFSGLGYTRDQLEAMSGSLLQTLLHPDDQVPYQHHAARLYALVDDEVAEFEYRLQHADGTWRWLYSRDMIFHRTEDGRARQIIGAALDVTQRREAEEALKEADRRKDEFLATLAHELRNPLAPIRNAVQILRLTGSKEPTLDSARDLIERQVNHLVRLVDDLLDVSRVSRGRIQLQTLPLDLAAVIQQAVETSRPLIDARRHMLSVVLPPEPIFVEGDFIRLAQVVSNLLNNAAKYTDAGGRIWLTAETTSGGSQSPAEAVVRVRDNGHGIEPPALKHLFDLFYQVDHTLDRADGGLGLGLSLVKRLVELHCGTVEAHSAGRGQGSEFIIRLPCLREALSTRPSAAPEALAQAVRRFRILVVDDNRDSAESLAMLLQVMGYETQTAYDGLEALEVAAAFQPEVVLLDIGMPNLNGYDTARRLRERPGGGALWLIAQTGWGQEQDRRQAAEAGFDGHLIKPVDPATLTALLASLASERERPLTDPQR